MEATQRFQSPQPSRTSSPAPAPSGTNNGIYEKYLESLDDISLLSYQSRARRNRPVVKDPIHLLGPIPESPSTIATNFLKSPLIVVAPSHLPDNLDTGILQEERGEETSEIARVWRVDVDEASKYDNSLIEGCNRGIDVLLVFTGLFSAVLTTFIIQAFQQLLPGPNKTTTQLLSQLVAAQTGRDVPLPPSDSPVSASQIHWVNGLWFAALACSLSTALISMLAKQWLQAYASRSSSSPRYMARERQRKYMHLLSWHVLGLINSMPLLLHVALLLFFAGIVILLWSVDYKISIATFIIVGFAYVFYLASIWLPFFYPSCPYQHPIHEPLKRLLSSYAIISPGSGPTSNHPTRPRRLASITADEIDAYALVWLFNHSTDREVISTALRAMAELPRDFQAFHVLRNAGAVQWVQQAFQSCFEKDATIDLKWHLNDPDGAWSYCRAWMNLTRGHHEQWPLELLEPLYRLQDFQVHPDGAAMASCVVAVSSIDSHLAQWELLAHLSKYASGTIHLSPSTLNWLLDSMIEGLVNWVMPAAIIEKTALRAVPVLLRLLRLTEGLPTSNVRSAIGVVLYIFTTGPVKLDIYWSESRRRDYHCEDMIIALSTIVSQPERFGVEDELWDTVTQELTKLASPMVAQYYRFTTMSREKARWSLFELLKMGRLGVGLIPDLVLVDVLHLLNPLPDILASQHPQVIKILIETLAKSNRQDVSNCAVQLLLPLLSRPSSVVLKAFFDSDGVNAVLRSAKSSDFDNRRLQVDSWRALCSLISTTATIMSNPPSPSPHQRDFASGIFSTDFFEALNHLILARRWTLLDVSGDWHSALLDLFTLRPEEPAWRTLVKAIRDAHLGGGARGHEKMAELAKAIHKRIRNLNKPDEPASDGSFSLGEIAGASRDEEIQTNGVTMMDQRQPMRRDSSSPSPPSPVYLGPPLPVKTREASRRNGSPVPWMFGKPPTVRGRSLRATASMGQLPVREPVLPVAKERQKGLEQQIEEEDVEAVHTVTASQPTTIRIFNTNLPEDISPM